MLEVNKLATLQAVIAHGSFSAAAHSLYLTQPAVSRQVSILERRLGVQLVRRTQRGAYATEAGELLVRHTQVIFDRLALAEAELGQLASLHGGRIRLGSFFTALAYLSAEVGMVLAEEHPGLVIVDDLVDRNEAFAKLGRGALEVAIVFEHDFEPTSVPEGIRTLTIFENPVRVLMPAGHRLAGQRKIHLQDLASETWVRPHDGSAARHVDHVLVQGHLQPDLILAGHGDEPVETQALVAAGRAITAAYDLNVIVRPDQIAVRPLVGVTSVRRIQAGYLAGQRSPAVTATIEALREVGLRRQGQLARPSTASPPG